MQNSKTPIRSRASITGIFITLLMILSLPLVIITSRQEQDIRQQASTHKSMTEAPGAPHNLTISGYVYYDLNENGERDYSEAGLNNAHLNISRYRNKNNSDFDIATIVSTDENGFFKYQPAGPGDYLVRLILPPDFKTINTNPRVISIPIGSPAITIEFGAITINPPASDNPYSIPSPTRFILR